MRYVRQEKKNKANTGNYINLQTGQKNDKVLSPEIEEYFMYSPWAKYPTQTLTGSQASKTAIKIAKDSVVYCSSGLVDRNKGTVLSYLHKAIKALNQLRMIEDSLVIYRLSRAPERRIFYIDVGTVSYTHLTLPTNREV